MEIKYEREIMSGLIDLTLADNMGDVKDALFDLCKGLNIDPPKWDDEKERYVLSFEDDYFGETTGN
jgi:hypothetical protein